MRKRSLSASLFRQYALLFFAAIMLIALGITFTLFYYSSEKLVANELKTTEASMTQAVNDIENQYIVLRNVAHQIRSTSAYRPSILNSSPYNDIELLGDFVRFANYSPLISQYFLFYRNSQKVYTSAGSTSYFSYFANAAFALTGDETDALYAQLNTISSEASIVLNNQTVLIFPIRFINAGSDTEYAALCFSLTQAQLMARMRLVASGIPAQLSLTVNGARLVCSDQLEPADRQPGVYELGGSSFLISVRSDNGIASALAQVEVERWPLLLSSVPAWLYVCIFLSLILVSAVAVLLARVAVTPMRRLIQKYATPDDYFRNEFLQLDQLVARIEAENQNSARLLRDRMLLTILRGYYSERLIDRWGFLHINFDKAAYRAAVIDTGDMPSASQEALKDAVEALSGEHVRVFALNVESNALIGVILCYDAPEAGARVQDEIRLRIGDSASLFAGRECGAPQRLSLSYLDALTACQRGQSSRDVDISGFAVKLAAAAEAGSEPLIDELCRQMLARCGDPSALLVKKFAIEMAGDLSALAAEKHITLDKERLNALVLLPDMPSCLKEAADIVRGAFMREPGVAATRMDYMASTIVAYINAHAFDPDLDLSSIGKEVSLSNDYVSSMVKSATGLAFKEYLTDLRLRRACVLLKEHAEMTVIEISESVGYRKASNFIKKFKEVYGVTPAQYR